MVSTVSRVGDNVGKGSTSLARSTRLALSNPSELVARVEGNDRTC
jgi:hypothetical protein